MILFSICLLPISLTLKASLLQDGKQLAEKAIEETYPEGGVVLKPSAIFGKRILPGEDGKTIPLHVRLRAHAAVCHRNPVLPCLADAARGDI